eukprot:CAMPEP_0204395898 /NCGR_PEP_ID=MMETSP0470-20130426/945_1 /ASSEMBLY_ACC=CAM_ASM_000385 /TAXON_ID=2969 /ORGANISM="Oxyrrhis marina" /LENGTH=90 /DNA_ID=CAMNT_0051390089 /DNA_START=17 /DNA_END=289 /DNA_ORIENTATION=-
MLSAVSDAETRHRMVMPRAADCEQLSYPWPLRCLARGEDRAGSPAVVCGIARRRMLAAVCAIMRRLVPPVLLGADCLVRISWGADFGSRE